MKSLTRRLERHMTSFDSDLSRLFDRKLSKPDIIKLVDGEPSSTYGEIRVVLRIRLFESLLDVHSTRRVIV